MLNDLLIELSTKLDHSRVVSILRQYNNLPLIDKYLLHVQHENLPIVNEAVNELCVAEEKFRQLRKSIDDYDKFDQIQVAQQLEKHELLEFRRISSYLYKLNKRWDKSLELSKLDNLWADTMETAAESKNPELTEELLYFFVGKGLHECFGACLYTCYDLIRPDVVLELAWRNGLTDFAMPFMIQSFRNFSDKLVALNTKIEAQDKLIHEGKKVEHDSNVGPPIYNPMLPLALPAPGMISSFAPPPGFIGGYPPM